MRRNRLRRLLLLSGSRPASASTFDYYIDSVAGSDSNTGRSEAQAWATIGKLTTAGVLANGVRIGLKRGGHWRETLDLSSYTGCTVGAYGSTSAARPKLNGSDIASAGAWSKTVGLTNVYQIAWSHSLDVAPSLLTVWVNGARLTFVTSQATCDATPGSFTYSGSVVGTSPITVYVNSTGSTNPGSDGKTYELTKRKRSLWLGPGGWSDSLLLLKAGYSANNTYELGSRATNCLFAHSQIHAAVAYGNTSFIGCDFYQIEANTRTGSVNTLTFYENTGGYTGTASNCRFDSGTSTDIPNAVYTHTVSSGQRWAAINLSGLAVRRVNLLASSSNELVTLNVTNCVAEQIADTAGAIQGSADFVNITNLLADYNLAQNSNYGKRASSFASPTVATIRDSRFLFSQPASGSAIRGTGQHDVQGCTFHYTGGSATAMVDDTCPATVIFKNNVCSAFNRIYNWFSNVRQPAEADYNVFYYNGTIAYVVNATNYSGFAAYRAAVPSLDINSVSQDPLFTGSPASNVWTFQNGSPVDTGGRAAGSRSAIAKQDWTTLNAAWDAEIAA